VFWNRKREPLAGGVQLAKAAGTVIASIEPSIAPLSAKPCVHWQTTVVLPLKTAEETVPSIAGLRSISLDGAALLQIAGGKRPPVPTKAYRKQGERSFAVELDNGRIDIDASGVVLTGFAEVMIPPPLARQRKLLEDWQLVGTYGVGRQDPVPAFEEIVLVVGGRVQVTGTVEIVEGRPQLRGEVTVHKRR
jgi:hypothetical protein